MQISVTSRSIRSGRKARSVRSSAEDSTTAGGRTKFACATSPSGATAGELPADRTKLIHAPKIEIARDEHLDAVRGLLDGSVAFEGLAIDTEVRWLIVRHLAAAGRAGEDLIASENRRDPTDAGARHAAAARAARPTPEAKAWAWEQILDPALPFATMRAIMGGFQQPDQDDLLVPYAEKYFGQIRPMFESRSIEVAHGFVNGMYPKMLVSEEIMAMTDEYLARQNPPASVRRLLLEGRDGILRALRARACDIEAGRGD